MAKRIIERNVEARNIAILLKGTLFLSVNKMTTMGMTMTMPNIFPDKAQNATSTADTTSPQFRK